MYEAATPPDMDKNAYIGFTPLADLRGDVIF